MESCLLLSTGCSSKLAAGITGSALPRLPCGVKVSVLADAAWAHGAQGTCRRGECLTTCCLMRWDGGYSADWDLWEFMRTVMLCISQTYTQPCVPFLIIQFAMGEKMMISFEESVKGR